MDTIMENTAQNTNNQKPNLLTKRNIFIVLGLIILAEVLWAGWTLMRPTPPPAHLTAPVAKPKPTTITLTTPVKTIKIGEEITVTINISSKKITDGTDLLITYDPKLLTVETVGAKREPVLAGTIYSDYPFNSVDQTPGRIQVSGITDDPAGVLADGLFGSVVFKGKEAGTTRISILHQVGSTADSNVTESGTGKDVLDKVEDLEVTILP